jgi:hypothetical protein
MIGEQIGETKGRRNVRRVLSTEPPTVEVTFEDSGRIFGVPTTGIGTYTSVIHPDGSICGEGKGISTTQDGDAFTWTATGSGKVGAGGTVSYRGMLLFRTASKKLTRLNNLCGSFEYAANPDGSTESRIWEWS